MKSQLAAQLQEVLNNMSQAEFDAEWNSIVALGLQGPTFEEAIGYLIVQSSADARFELASELTFNQPITIGNDIYSQAA